MFLISTFLRSSLQTRGGGGEEGDHSSKPLRVIKKLFTDRNIKRIASLLCQVPTCVCLYITTKKRPANSLLNVITTSIPNKITQLLAWLMNKAPAKCQCEFDRQINKQVFCNERKRVAERLSSSGEPTLFRVTGSLIMIPDQPFVKALRWGINDV